MENNEILLAQIETMENYYIHSMQTNFAFLSEKFEEIDQNKIYSIDEMRVFFSKHQDLYET